MRKIILISILSVISLIYASGSADMVRHQVRPQENLFRISLIYNSTVNDIVQANPGLDPNMVRSGMIIKVPTNTKIRDTAFVSALLYATPINKDQAIPVATPALACQEENPSVWPAKLVSPMQQGEHESSQQVSVLVKYNAPAPQMSICDTASEQYKSEAMQNRYLELKRLAEHDKSIRVLDLMHIQIPAEGATVQK